MRKDSERLPLGAVSRADGALGSLEALPGHDDTATVSERNRDEA